MLYQSFNIGKSDNDLELLKVIFNILLSDIIDNVKLGASYVNEMTYEFVSKYLSNELDNDVNEFENAHTFAVCHSVTFSKRGKISARSYFSLSDQNEQILYIS